MFYNTWFVYMVVKGVGCAGTAGRACACARADTCMRVGGVPPVSLRGRLVCEPLCHWEVADQAAPGSGLHRPEPGAKWKTLEEVMTGMWWGLVLEGDGPGPRDQGLSLSSWSHHCLTMPSPHGVITV